MQAGDGMSREDRVEQLRDRPRQSAGRRDPPCRPEASEREEEHRDRDHHPDRAEGVDDVRDTFEPVAGGIDRLQ